MRRRFDRPIAALLTVTAVALSFTVVTLAVNAWDVTRLVVFGKAFVDRTSLPAEMHVIDGVGYDGQFYYRLAVDPATREVIGDGVRFDNPPYRQQRILYPVLAWIAGGGGRPRAVPFALLAINVVAIAMLGLVGAAVACDAGRHALWGALFAAYPGFLWTLSRDLGEILASLLLLAGVLAIRRERPVWATVALVAAMFARETTLVLAAGAAVSYVVHVARTRRIAWTFPAYVFGAPLAVYAAWQWFLYFWWGRVPLLAGSGNEGLPFAGLVRRYMDPNVDAFGDVYVLIVLVFVIGVAVVTAPSVSHRGPMVHEKAGWALALVLFVCRADFVGDTGFLRATTELYVLGLLIVLADPRGLLRQLAAGTAAGWTTVALGRVVHPG